MSLPDLMAVSLILSLAVAAVALAAGEIMERRVADPGLRERAWAVALAVAAAPPVLTLLWLVLAPAPVRVVTLDPDAAAAGMATAATAGAGDAAAVSWAVSPAGLLLGAAALVALLRGLALVCRAVRLERLRRRAAPAGPEVAAAMAAEAVRVGRAAPAVRVSAEAAEAMVVGLFRPCLILSPTLARTVDRPGVRAVLAHELAHLRRGDLRAVWLEEALLVLFAFNPVIPFLRARRAAAREEACDALALRGASPDLRRAFARLLLDALRSRAAPPALSLTGAPRSSVMHRLQSVLAPAAPAGRTARGLVAASLAGSVVAVLAASGAVAAQRQEVVRLVTVSAPPLDGTAERYRRVSARGLQLICATGQAEDARYCAGILLSTADDGPRIGVCAPAAVRAREAGPLAAFLAEARERIAATPPRTDEGAHGFADRVLQAAYPCGARTGA
jgi:beta-lactamase regulating signal transducer with metallopeptidase domain